MQHPFHTPDVYNRQRTMCVMQTFNYLVYTLPRGNEIPHNMFWRFALAKVDFPEVFVVTEEPASARVQILIPTFRPSRDHDRTKVGRLLQSTRQRSLSFISYGSESCGE